MWVASTVEPVPTGKILPARTNPRAHTKEQVGQIAESIKLFGFTNPLLVDETYRVIAGHGRLLAARHLGLTSVPCIVIAHLTEHEKAALVIADNQLALNAAWDDDLLRKSLDSIDGELARFIEEIGISGDDLSSYEGEEDLGNKIRDASDVADTFWISICGPLTAQAESYRRISDALRGIPDVTIDIGTTKRDLW